VRITQYPPYNAAERTAETYRNWFVRAHRCCWRHWLPHSVAGESSVSANLDVVPSGSGPEETIRELPSQANPLMMKMLTS
jgi:hypothetical protein